MRESPSLVLMDKLAGHGAEIAYYDPYVPAIPLTRDHPQWSGLRSITWNEASVRRFDVCLISTAHDIVDYQQLADWSSLIIDTRNAMKKVRCKPGQVWKA